MLDYVNMYTFVTLPCSFHCEMLDIDPMAMKFCMMILNMLMDLCDFIWHFLLFPSQFATHVL